MLTEGRSLDRPFCKTDAASISSAERNREIPSSSVTHDCNHLNLQNKSVVGAAWTAMTIFRTFVGPLTRTLP